MATAAAHEERDVEGQGKAVETPAVVATDSLAERCPGGPIERVVEGHVLDLGCGTATRPLDARAVSPHAQRTGRACEGTHAADVQAKLTAEDAEDAADGELALRIERHGVDGGVGACADVAFALVKVSTPSSIAPVRISMRSCT